MTLPGYLEYLDDITWLFGVFGRHYLVIMRCPQRVDQ